MAVRAMSMSASVSTPGAARRARASAPRAAMRARARACASPALADVGALCAAAEAEGGLAGVAFNDAMAVVDASYEFTPTAYTSGKGTAAETANPAGTNSGSCKCFAFAKERGLSEAAALRLFCEHYEQVLGDPDGDTHLNIRAFQANGWEGIHFEGEPLSAK